MKKLITKFISVICLISIISGSDISAQITLEQTYTGTYIGYGNTRMVYLSISGYKYSKYEPDSYRLTLYNLDHSVFKTVNINIGSIMDTSILLFNRYNGISYISENLFDLDNEVEFLLDLVIDDTAFSFFPIVAVINEDGNPIFTAKPASTSDILNERYGIAKPPITNTSNGAKMILNRGFNGDTIEVYSLPGSIPCDTICGGVGTGKVELSGKTNTSQISNSYPNPTNGVTTIHYKLPPGVNEGEIVFYNLQGIEVKRYKVDRTFNNLQLDASALSSGAYLYHLITSNNPTSAKKMIVIK